MTSHALVPKIILVKPVKHLLTFVDLVLVKMEERVRYVTLLCGSY